MKLNWGLVCLSLCCGCAGGPDDLVSQSNDSASETSVAASDSKPSEIIQVASTAPAEFTTTLSGLKYRVMKEGKGRKPNANSTVTCHYKGWLDNGKEFDSSYGGSAATFPLGGVIKGWTEGLQLVQEGGKIELEIPSELGYGASGSPPTIPPGATLHFEIELFKVR